jgi:hypothetical protein
MSRNHHLLLHSILALALGMGASAGAFAQGPGGGTWGGRGPGPAPFDLMDLDGNGGISAAEHAQFRAERQRAMAAQGRPMRNAANAPAFEAIDTDGDGQISPGEMTQMRQARMANRGYGPGFGPRGPVGLGPGPGAGNNRPCWRSNW